MEITIRPMQDDEKKEVRKLVRDAFRFFEWIFFYFTSDIFVAELRGELVGGVLPKMFNISDDQKGGLISWLFTSPKVQGLGVGQQLVEGALQYLENEGCDVIFACVEGLNTSSSKIFATRGFEIISMGEQLRRYSFFQMIKIWFNIFHYMDIGHFVWIRPAPQRHEKQITQLARTFFLNSLIVLLAIWSRFGFRLLPWQLILLAPLALLSIVGLRLFIMWLEVRGSNVPMRYRPWDSGYFLSFGVAAFSLPFILPGSFYPDVKRWRYSEFIPQLGRSAFFSSLSVLILTWLSFIILNMFSLPLLIADLLFLIGFIGRTLLVLDVILVFFPFVPFNGKRIFDWNKFAWGSLVAAVVLLFISYYLL
ncbi:MAG: GNAT family N-acetyltransferase [Promethearchaeia archaeon]